MSSEKRRIAPNAFDKDVPPLKIRVGASFFGIEEALQGPADPEVFLDDGIGDATYRSGLAEERGAIEVSRRATLSIELTGHGIGDGDQSWPHPCRSLDSVRGEHLLVARRQPADRDLNDIGRSNRPQMPQSLNDGASRAAGSDQVLG